MVRRLIVNADDYGRCREVNSAVEELISAEKLRSVSVLVNGDDLNSAVRFLLGKPHVSAGVHWNAVEGSPVVPDGKWLTGEDGKFIGLGRLMIRWMSQPKAVSRAVEAEWRAQTEALFAAGIHLSHADSHQHLHAFPPAWRIAVKLCHEFGIPALRLPRERNPVPIRRAGAFALASSLAFSRFLAGNSGVRHNHHLLGFKRAGAYGIQQLVNDLRHLPAGITELALHPSTTDGNPYPNLYGNLERQALLHPAFPEVLAELKIAQITWNEISK